MTHIVVQIILLHHRVEAAFQRTEFERSYSTELAVVEVNYITTIFLQKCLHVTRVYYRNIFYMEDLHDLPARYQGFDGSRSVTFSSDQLLDKNSLIDARQKASADWIKEERAFMRSINWTFVIHLRMTKLIRVLSVVILYASLGSLRTQEARRFSECWYSVVEATHIRRTLLLCGLTWERILVATKC